MQRLEAADPAAGAAQYATCMACHGGTIDQNTGHGGNWAGSSMASAARDPVFRANQIIVNNAIRTATGENGAGNICMRCHSPNGWLSGRFDNETTCELGRAAHVLASFLFTSVVPRILQA